MTYNKPWYHRISASLLRGFPEFSTRELTEDNKVAILSVAVNVISLIFSCSVMIVSKILIPDEELKKFRWVCILAGVLVLRGLFCAGLFLLSKSCENRPVRTWRIGYNGDCLQVSRPRTRILASPTPLPLGMRALKNKRFISHSESRAVATGLVHPLKPAGSTDALKKYLPHTRLPLSSIFTPQKSVDSTVSNLNHTTPSSAFDQSITPTLRWKRKRRLDATFLQFAKSSSKINPSKSITIHEIPFDAVTNSNPIEKSPFTDELKSFQENAETLSPQSAHEEINISHIQNTLENQSMAEKQIQNSCELENNDTRQLNKVTDSKFFSRKDKSEVKTMATELCKDEHSYNGNLSHKTVLNTGPPIRSRTFKRLVCKIAIHPEKLARGGKVKHFKKLKDLFVKKSIPKDDAKEVLALLKSHQKSIRDRFPDKHSETDSNNPLKALNHRQSVIKQSWNVSTYLPVQKVTQAPLASPEDSRVSELSLISSNELDHDQGHKTPNSKWYV